ncbi:MAG: M56 family metallopeptidase [bacterium]|nr:M56 family metallopeptidase [bacterium]
MSNPEFLNLLFVQTWQVAIVAIAVGAVTRYLARSQPQLSHLLWGLVLLKVLTPPLWSSPTSVFAWLARGENVVLQSLQTASQTNLGDDRGRVSSLTLSQQPAIRLELQLAASSTATRRTAEAASLTETQLEVSSTREIDSLSRRLSKFLVPFWLTGVGVIAMLGLLRIGSFWRRATRRTSYNMPDKLSELARLEQRMQAMVHQTARKLRIRRKIRLRIIDAPIGPAVIGLMRPTILMPAGIAENRSPEFLEPILAHELIHIRRGDLYWSALQSLATNLLWIHPPVRYASRKISIE